MVSKTAQKAKTVTTQPKKKKDAVLLSACPREFSELFYAHALKSDLAGFEPRMRHLMAASSWDMCQKRKKGEVKLRVYNPTVDQQGWSAGHTVLETVNDDMPFLVDSVTATLQRRGLAIHLVIHPVLSVERDARGQLVDYVDHHNPKAVEKAKGKRIEESLIHVQFDLCDDPHVCADIENEIKAVLADVRAAVEDWPKMKDCLATAIEQASAHPVDTRQTDTTDEVRAFLSWMADNNFTFLGYREIDLLQKSGELVSVRVKADGLGVLRSADVRLFGGMRDLDARQSKNLQRYVREHSLLVVTKANIISRVHRAVPLDAVFVRRFGKDGAVVSEQLFVGLFTSQSYAQSPRQIPFLRSKIDFVTENAGLVPTSHDGKALAHILNHYPHDELFQISEDELLANSLGILKLQERARVAVFVRHDPFERFVTCLIYVPRDRYDSAMRKKINAYLESAFAGKAHDWVVRIDDSLLARLFVTIHTTPHSPRPDASVLEAELRDLCRSWSDRLRESLTQVYGEGEALRMQKKYSDAFSAGYQENIGADVAVGDIACLERVEGQGETGLIVNLDRDEKEGQLHLKIFNNAKPIVLSEVLPLIENLGLKIEYMNGPFEVSCKDRASVTYVHEFVGKPARASVCDFLTIKPVVEETLTQVIRGSAENDGFNALSLHAAMPWRRVVVLRMFARYLRQLRVPYSHELMAATFVRYPTIALDIADLFVVRHDPLLKGNRTKLYAEGLERLMAALTKVEGLEEDRIIRRNINLVQASLRTNFFQKQECGGEKSFISVKFDSRAIEFMPLPKPLFEIFVYSPRVEAVHLRGGKVARGGIRWSDRRDDFRNEILGLIKAQMVKNTVIVPVGSKGGFIVKNPPSESDKFQAEGIECYRIMMRGLLDITDNRVNGKIVPPPSVVRHDADDPYLVVAADKGTAKFSDIANGISRDYGFWLDDAFASGGSVGYDHKAMGITARGAWETIKRHFREIGKDIQKEDFTCIGVGDMSGDVFGNGMLLSKHTRLIAAFDHRHIFCDPNADAAQGFVERQRLFNLPRSSWDDYDRTKISKGGGVFTRSAKSIKISPEMKKAYGLTADQLSPSELMQAMLKAEVELLYFGGIGTYVKAAMETHEEVSDRANDAIRVDGGDIRAQVVGEGANLGCTQRGRVEYALRGGRINTDAIDNSAGVDTSDHEVNIKILMRQIMSSSKMSLDERNKLLRSMTDDVAELVLRDNYQQSQAMSVVEAQAAERLSMHSRCMHLLEKSGLLNRKVEFLPDADEIADRHRIGKGLTRPEIAVLIAYAKLWLYDQVLASDLPDDKALQSELLGYFPDALQKKYAKHITEHQLSREITATIVTNELVNRAGSAFALIVPEQTGHSIAAVARAFMMVRRVLNLDGLWADIEAQDNKISASAQVDMMLVIKKALTNAAQKVLSHNVLSKGTMTQHMEIYAKGAERIKGWLVKSGRAGGHTVQRLLSAKVPQGLAERVAVLPSLVSALDLIPLSIKTGQSLDLLSELSFGLGQRLGLDWLQEQARGIQSLTPWQRDAIVASLQELGALHLRITADALGRSVKGNPSVEALQKNWIERHSVQLDRYDLMVNDWRSSGTVDIAMLTLAVRHLSSMV